MKVLAFYLPQFHEIPENSLWWGEGFTEWTAVKAAKPLFLGHKQPKEPYNNNYYDLTDKETIRWQEKLFHKSGLDGLCIYHYYFKDGKKVLEKPAENLLKWKEINIPFCFCWANESWVRSWSNISDGNDWGCVFDGKTKIEGNGILLEQKYGGKEDWIKHYDYLRQFFLDDRYIKIDGRPVFMIYKLQNISCLSDMISVWRDYAIKKGDPPMYIIGGEYSQGYENIIDLFFISEPFDTVLKFFDNTFEDPSVRRKISYNAYWEKLISKQLPRYKACIGALSGYDDTPRRGRDGCVIDGATPEKLEKYLYKLLLKGKKNNVPFVFINAWNEWGEGMYIEPDSEYGYEYLTAINNAISKSINSSYELSENGEYLSDESTLISEIDSLNKLVNRYRCYWTTMDKMLRKIERREKVDYFSINNINKVSIYGIGMLGMHFIKNFLDGVELVYAVDQKGDAPGESFPVYRLGEKLPESDLMIIAVPHEYIKIKSEIMKYYTGTICSIDELLDA